MILTNDLLARLGWGHTVPFIADELCNLASDDDVEEAVIAKLECLRLLDVLSAMDPADASLLGARFGIARDAPTSLRVLGAQMNTSHSTVRRRERAALQRLRDVFGEAT